MTVEEQFLQLLQNQDLPLYIIMLIYLYMKFNDLSTRLTRLETKFNDIENYLLRMAGVDCDEENER